MKKKLKQADKELMYEMIFQVNNEIMDMVGIHPNRDGYILTDIDRAYVQHKNKKLRLFNITKDDIAFRPLYNSKLMLMMFGLFTKRLKEEEGRELDSFEYGEGGKKDKIVLSCTEVGYDPIFSKPYYNDSIRFFDIMCQLNETASMVNLEVLDELMNT